MIFRDRADAGRVLTRDLRQYGERNDVLVLGLPRGGVPVAFEVARELGAPLDVFVVRKLGAPGQEELAMGAIASGGVRVLNSEVVHLLGVSGNEIAAITQREEQELERRERLYRGDRPPIDPRGKIVILIDDGLATGSTMKAAAKALRRLDPQKIVVAVPVASASTCEDLAAEVDEVVCAATPEPFYAVGQWYASFTQTTDDEVRDLLERASQPQQAA